MNPYQTVELFSVCGIHPSEGQLVYSAYQCFSSREEADLWRNQQGPPHFPYAEVVSHNMEAVHLDQSGAKAGDLVWWKRLGSDKPFFGWLKEWDNGTAIIRIDLKDKAIRGD